MSSAVIKSLVATFLMKAILPEGASGEPLTRCFDGVASMRLMCPKDSLIWVKWGFYGVAQDSNFCRSSVVSRRKDCLPNEPGQRWAIATDCNLFSNCLTFHKPFQAEVAETCKIEGPTYSQVAFECLSRFKSDTKILIDYIFLSTEPSQDVVDEKLFLMSERYASATSGDIGYCQIRLPALSSARFRLLDLRGRTVPETTETCPYKLYIYSGVYYKEWCAAGGGFIPDEYWIEPSDYELLIDVVFTRVSPKALGAVWILMEGKKRDGIWVTGMTVNCGSGAVLQSLQDRKTTWETTTASTTGTTRGTEEQPGPSAGRVYYILKSTMAAKIPGADGVVDNMAISRDSKGKDAVLRMNVYSRDFGQQWFFDSGQRIRNRVDSKCMAVNEERELVLIECRDSDPTQAWLVQKDLGILKNVELGDVIQVKNNLPNSGAVLDVGPNKDARYQKFIFEEAPRYFKIISKANGMIATLSSATERSKVTMQQESAPLKDDQIFYHDSKNVIRTKIQNYALDTRSGTVLAVRFLGVNKDNNWTYSGKFSKIINGGETSASLRVLQIKPDMTLTTSKSTTDANQIFDIRYVE